MTSPHRAVVEQVLAQSDAELDALLTRGVPPCVCECVRALHRTAMLQLAEMEEIPVSDVFLAFEAGFSQAMMSIFASLALSLDTNPQALAARMLPAINAKVFLGVAQAERPCDA